MDEQKASACEAVALASFISESRAHRIDAWARVESLKAACAAEINADAKLRAMSLEVAWLAAESETLRAESQGPRASL